MPWLDSRSCERGWGFAREDEVVHDIAHADRSLYFQELYSDKLQRGVFCAAGCDAAQLETQTKGAIERQEISDAGGESCSELAFFMKRCT